MATDIQRLADAMPTATLWFVIKTTLLSSSVGLVVLFIASSILSQTVDPREPSELKPTIPFIGHFIGKLRHRMSFLTRMAEKHHRPIASLLIGNSKEYAVWDSHLIQAVYRNKNLSIGPYVIENTRNTIGFSQHTYDVIHSTTIFPEYMTAIYSSTGQPYLDMMTRQLFRYISTRLDQLPSGRDEFVVDDWWTWGRDLMTAATSISLLGPKCPFVEGSPLLDDLWTFETYVSALMINIFPSITARKGLKARKRLQDALGDYYSSFGDEHEDAAEQTKRRAQVLRKFGIDNREVGVLEVSMITAATFNTIPTIFWFLTYILSYPNLLQRLRAELDELVVRQSSTTGSIERATINIDLLIEKAPLLLSCFHETIRLTNKTMIFRRAMADASIADGHGNEYLLKSGSDLEATTATMHLDSTTWGDGADIFIPERFLQTTVKQLSPEHIRARKVGYTPFGGGKHLCPGRSFALNESLGFVGALLTGFEVDLPDHGVNKSGFKVPKQGQPAIGLAITKPAANAAKFGFKLRRRNGWEHVKWAFECGGDGNRVHYEPSRP